MRSLSKVNFMFFMGLNFLLISCGGGSGTVTGSGETLFTQFLAKAASLYSTQPSLSSCKTGTLLDTEKQKVIAVLNEIRKAHGLGSVAYDYNNDEQVMQTALMMSANAELSHNPPTSWKCYSATGALGAGSSNLSGGSAYPNLAFQSVENDVIGWLTETNNAIANNIGHRRWLLDPFLTKIAYGRVATAFDADRVVDGSAIKVVYPANSSSAVASGDYIAYPVGDYPAKYFTSGALLSLSVLSSVSDRFANASVDFSKVTVGVTQRGGLALVVKNVAFDNVVYGLPNNIQFNAEGIMMNIVYDVIIKGVKVNGVTKDFNYWFRIVS